MPSSTFRQNDPDTDNNMCNNNSRISSSNWSSSRSSSTSNSGASTLNTSYPQSPLKHSGNDIDPFDSSIHFYNHPLSQNSPSFERDNYSEDQKHTFESFSSSLMDSYPIEPSPHFSDSSFFSCEEKKQPVPPADNSISFSLLRKRCLNKLLNWQNFLSQKQETEESKNHHLTSSVSYTPPQSPSSLSFASSTSAWCLSPEVAFSPSIKETKKCSFSSLNNHSIAPVTQNVQNVQNCTGVGRLDAARNLPENSLCAAATFFTNSDASLNTSISVYHNHNPTTSFPSLDKYLTKKTPQLHLNTSNSFNVSSSASATPSSSSPSALTFKNLAFTAKHSFLHPQALQTAPPASACNFISSPCTASNSNKIQSADDANTNNNRPRTKFPAFCEFHSTTNMYSAHGKKNSYRYPSLPKKSSLNKYLLIFLILSVIFLSSSAASFLYYADEPKNCRMSFMSPSFIKLEGFNQNYTRHYSKYTLYLYRETEIDNDNAPPCGIPVLFIPGNAGSFRQVRALAAQSATLYQSGLGEKSKFLDHSNPYDKPIHPQFDYYTADFNEDLTAFHGRSLLDQAEYLNDAVKYILSLYNSTNFVSDFRGSSRTDDNSNSNYDTQHPFFGSSANNSYPNPLSVILIGHSMGGVVARSMFLLDNYQAGSVNSIFTLSAPHTLPPAPFDRDLVSVYDRVNSHWENSFSQDFIGRNPLAQVSLISITGGNLDKMILSESTSVSSFVPPSNGFTVFTTSIPHVWSSIDHQAIVWCDQFRQVFATVLSEMADVNSATKTKSLPERMNVFRRLLLGGFRVGAVPEYLQTRYHPSLATDLNKAHSKISSGSSSENLPKGTATLLSESRRSKKVEIIHDSSEYSVSMDAGIKFSESEREEDVEDNKFITAVDGKSLSLKDQPFIPPNVGNHDTLLWVEDFNNKIAIPNDSNGNGKRKLAIRQLGQHSKNPANRNGYAYFVPLYSVSPATTNSDSNSFSVGSKEDLEFSFLTDNILIPYQPIVKPSSFKFEGSDIHNTDSSVNNDNTNFNNSAFEASNFESHNSKIPFNFKSGKVKSGLYALACRYPHVTELKHSGTNLNVIDLTKRSGSNHNDDQGDNHGIVGMLCKNIAGDISVLPNPNQVDRFEFDDENDGEKTEPGFYKIPKTNVGRMSYIKYEAAQLAGYDFITIIDTNTEHTAGFAIAELSKKRQSRVNVKTESFWELLHGVSVTLPADRPFMVDLSFQNIWSSLLSYKVMIQTGNVHCHHRTPTSKRSARSSPSSDVSDDTHSSFHESRANNKLFKTFIRQYVGDSYESKYYMDVDFNNNSNQNFSTEAVTTIPINIEGGVAPFSPFDIRESDSDFENNLFYYDQKSHYYHNLHLQIWSDSSAPSLTNGKIFTSSLSSSRSVSSSPKEMEIVIKLDLAASLGKLLMHYRIALACFPVAIISCILLIQFYIYNTYGNFITAEDALTIFIKRFFFYFVLVSFVLPYIGSMQFLRDILYFFEPGMDVYSRDGPASIFTTIRRNQFFLGLEPGHLPFLGPFFIATGVGLTVMTILVLRLVILLFYGAIVCGKEVMKYLTSVIIKCTGFNRTKKESDFKASEQRFDVNSQHVESERREEYTDLTVSEINHPRVFQWTTSRFGIIRRVVVTTFLFMAVAYTIPCEFAYLVSFFVQLSTSTTTYYRLRSGYTVIINNRGQRVSLPCFFNFCFSLLLLMFWMVPITAPILVVWGRKMAAHWNEAFQSHHNLLSIGPILLLVETVSSGKLVPRTAATSTTEFSKHVVTYVGLAYITAVAIVIGVQRTYLLYQLVNVFSAWLLTLFVIERVKSFRRSIRKQGENKIPEADDRSSWPINTMKKAKHIAYTQPHQKQTEIEVWDNEKTEGYYDSDNTIGESEDELDSDSDQSLSIYQDNIRSHQQSRLRKPQITVKSANNSEIKNKGYFPFEGSFDWGAYQRYQQQSNSAIGSDSCPNFNDSNICSDFPLSISYSNDDTKNKIKETDISSDRKEQYFFPV